MYSVSFHRNDKKKISHNWHSIFPFFLFWSTENKWNSNNNKTIRWLSCWHKIMETDSLLTFDYSRIYCSTHKSTIHLNWLQICSIHHILMLYIFVSVSLTHSMTASFPCGLSSSMIFFCSFLLLLLLPLSFGSFVFRSSLDSSLFIVNNKLFHTQEHSRYSRRSVIYNCAHTAQERRRNKKNERKKWNKIRKKIKTFLVISFFGSLLSCF